MDSGPVESRGFSMSVNDLFHDVAARKSETGARADMVASLLITLQKYGIAPRFKVLQIGGTAKAKARSNVSFENLGLRARHTLASGLRMSTSTLV